VGWGLVIAALIFGLAHPLSVAAPYPGAWAVWVSVFGAVIGFLREKSNGLLAPATLHAAAILPTAFVPAG